MTIPMSKLGPGQLIDVEHSGDEIHDEFFRTCTVLQGDPPISDIGDDVPYRIAKFYGGPWTKWNKHFVAQVAGCPLKCWYCYVDNLEPDKDFSIEELVRSYVEFHDANPDINVFHLMGGCPGKFAFLWPGLRETLDQFGCRDTIILTDVILVEDYLYYTRPWVHIPERTIVSVCLKGTNFQNFARNTGMNYFAVAMHELWAYARHGFNMQLYYTLIEWDPGDKGYIEALLVPDRINWLKVKEYEVVRRRHK